MARGLRDEARRSRNRIRVTVDALKRADAPTFHHDLTTQGRLLRACAYGTSTRTE